MCNHVPRCPAATARESLAARIRVPHPEQGWYLLCNGVVVFDDGGALLPSGEAILAGSDTSGPLRELARVVG